jgi:ABC-2 type transport system permease protein
MKWTAGLLFRRRVLRYWQDQVKVWRTALDWTVWVYLLIPGVWIGGGFYREWWMKPPAWMIDFPLWLVAILPLVWILSGKLRVFVEDGDMLFLLQKQDWIRKLTGFGAGYTLAVQGVGTTLLFVLLLPLLVKGSGLTGTEVILLGLCTFLFKMVQSVADNLIGSVWRGWRRYGAAGLLSVLLLSGYAATVTTWGYEPAPLSAACAGLAIVLFVSITARIRLQGAFEADVRRERKAKMGSTELLLTGVIRRKPVASLSRPLVLRRSGRIFRQTDSGTVLAEMRMKAFIRKWSYVRLWLGFIGIGTAAILASPGWLALCLLALLPIPAAIWVHSHWKDWLDESFIAQFKWSDEAARKGATLSRFWLLVPAIGWLSLVAGWQYAGAASMILTAVIAVVGWRLLNNLLGELFALRKK